MRNRFESCKRRTRSFEQVREQHHVHRPNVIGKKKKTELLSCIKIVAVTPSDGKNKCTHKEEDQSVLLDKVKGLNARYDLQWENITVTLIQYYSLQSVTTENAQLKAERDVTRDQLHAQGAQLEELKMAMQRMQKAKERSETPSDTKKKTAPAVLIASTTSADTSATALWLTPSPPQPPSSVECHTPSDLVHPKHHLHRNDLVENYLAVVASAQQDEVKEEKAKPQADPWASTAHPIDKGTKRAATHEVPPKVRTRAASVYDNRTILLIFRSSVYESVVQRDSSLTMTTLLATLMASRI